MPSASVSARIKTMGQALRFPHEFMLAHRADRAAVAKQGSPFRRPGQQARTGSSPVMPKSRCPSCR